MSIDHHAKFKMLKLNFCGSDKKNANKFKPLFVAIPKFSDWIQKYVQIQHSFSFSKMVLKSVLALKISHFYGQKLPETHDDKILDPPNPLLFCIKDKKSIYTECMTYIDLCSCQLTGLLKKI